ncbi:MAG TPA: hypothetical protein VGP41_04355 [Candidatus Lustribacter sp.]|jgi:hypothetical protein|nr:hypothetical protein [Candidatus Lustribacter sp.]
MFKHALLSAVAAATILGCSVAAQAQTSSMSSSSSMSTMGGTEHGMPEGTMGADGVAYTGAPDLQAAVSLVVAGGPVGDFSITKAITALAGAATANAEVAKLTKQYGAAKVTSFVTVQNFAVDDAVKHAAAAGVKFPAPALKGAALAKRVTVLGLVDGTYYEGVMLDHLVSHAIHEAVMVDIDNKFGAAADANYHRIADQAHVDLAHALGVTSVKLAAYH